MLDTQKVIKKMAWVVRNEQRALETRYAQVCKLLSDIIDKDASFPAEQKQQHKMDKAKELWDGVYASYEKDLKELLFLLNKFKIYLKKDDGSA